MFKWIKDHTTSQQDDKNIATSWQHRKQHSWKYIVDFSGTNGQVSTNLNWHNVPYGTLFDWKDKNADFQGEIIITKRENE